MAPAHTSLSPIDAEVVRGRKPLTASQFRELDSDAHTNRNTTVEMCLADINAKLLGRSFRAECSYSFVSIRTRDQGVIEAALTIMREQGGWHTADIRTMDDKGWCVLRLHA